MRTANFMRILHIWVQNSQRVCKTLAFLNIQFLNILKWLLYTTVVNKSEQFQEMVVVFLEAKELPTNANLE